MWCGGFNFVWWFRGKVVVGDGRFVSLGPLLRPLALSAPSAYNTVGPLTTLAFEDTFTSLQSSGTFLALAFVLSCVGYRRVVDGLFAAPRTVSEFHVSCSSFPRVYGSTAVFANVDATFALALVGVVTERRVACFADLGSWDSSGRKLPVTAT